jgi:hypothetical protein
VAARWSPIVRALIAERTKAGLQAARQQGRVGGNPGLRRGDPEAIKKVTAARDAAYLATLIAGAEIWLPTVKRMRPSQSWAEVVKALNGSDNEGSLAWTEARLRKSVHRLIIEGLADKSLLVRAKPQPYNHRLISLVADIKAGGPDLTLRQIAAQLEAMQEQTPRGMTRWRPSSVRNLLKKAAKQRIFE